MDYEESQAPEDVTEDAKVTAKKGKGKKAAQLIKPKSTKVDAKEDKPKAKDDKKKKKEKEQEDTEDTKDKEEDDEEENQENAKVKGKDKAKKETSKKPTAKKSTDKGKKATKDKKEKKEKKEKDKNQPKRAKNAYLFFTMEMRAVVKKEMPDLNMKEQTTELAARWNAADDKQKKKFNDMAAADKIRYKQEMDKYVQSTDFSKNGGAKRKKSDEDDEEEEKESTPTKKVATTEKVKGKPKPLLAKKTTVGKQ